MKATRSLAALLSLLALGAAALPSAAQRSSSHREPLVLTPGPSASRPFVLGGPGDRPGWLPTFSSSGLGVPPDDTLHVRAMAVFDAGDGPELHVGGIFQEAGGQSVGPVVRWNGRHWRSVAGIGRIYDGLLGPELTDIRAMTVFDDGSGAALYVGGICSIDGANVGRWDGQDTVALGTGTNDLIRSLVAYDDGNGPALYAGGDFTEAGGVPASHVARWDGSAWSPLSSGVDDNVHSLTVHDDGSGPVLIAGGTFSHAGGVSASRVASWDGIAWTSMGSELGGLVLALVSFDPGDGARLYAAGDLQIGGGSAAPVQRWDGNGWEPIGTFGDADVVTSLKVLDDGSGAALYASGPHLSRWDGTEWTEDPFGTGGIESLAVCDFGGGPELLAGSSGGCMRLGMEGNMPLGTGIRDGEARAMVRFDDGTGEALYVGGTFSRVGNDQTGPVVAWKNGQWRRIIDPGGPSGSVEALAVHDDGSGPALFVGGFLATFGNVARWNGSEWAMLGPGLPTFVKALKVFDDGTGPALFAGTGDGVLRWDGVSWARLGEPFYQVLALEVFDDGSGPRLYAGGAFMQPERFFARWDGSSWQGLGSLLNNWVYSLVAFDDGGGPALFLGGEFSLGPWKHVVRFDGTSLLPMGGASARVSSLAVLDDGSGPALYAGGSFDEIGGVPASHVARWAGSRWSRLGAGLEGPVLTMTDLGGDLVFGGDLRSRASGDQTLGLWGRDAQPAQIDHPDVVYAVEPRNGGPGAIVSFEVSARDLHDAYPSVAVDPPSGSVFPLGTTTVTVTATDDAGNTAQSSFPVTVYRKFRLR